jgi:23S rRNA (uracil1939-C5)-methyltransferase
MPRRPATPFEVLITHLDSGNLGIGHVDGRRVAVRCAPPGARLRVWPIKKRRGVLLARRDAMVEPPPDAATPRCGVFGVCGGCSLQELGMEAQRIARLDLVVRGVGSLEGVTLHPFPCAHAGSPWGYRNKVELAYGNHRFLVPDEHRAGLPNEGRFLGFHAPDRFNRIVEPGRCEIAGPATNLAMTAARAHLQGSRFECWDVRAFTGFWRHLLLREAQDGDCVGVVFTAEPEPGREAEARAEVEALASALTSVKSLVWSVNARTCDAASGTPREVFGAEPSLEERIGHLRFRLSPTSFFQANTVGARALYDAVAASAGSSRLLLDLYCGTGTIGLYLASAFEQVIGIDENPSSTHDAEANARLNGIEGIRFLTGRAENIVEGLALEDPSGVSVVVDPPRVGLHPRVARWLAALPAERLVYVACHPPSLGRDREVLGEGGWRLRELRVVDLFPHTGHVETVGLFLRED